MDDQALVPVAAPSCQVPSHQTALHQAAVVGNSEALAALIQGGCALDLQNRDGNTALHEVSWHGFSQCVKLLVKAGADVHIRNKAGNTALHLACQNAHAAAARILLLAGATPDTKNNVDDTCLHVAARYNNQTMVKILLHSLCSVTERNQRGDTALHVAAALNHKKAVQLLLEAGTEGKIRNNAGRTALDTARDNNHKDLAILLARAPQVHRFMRGRTIRKQRERLIAERRTQSVTRVEILPNKEDSSSEQMENRNAVKVDPQPHRQQQQLSHSSPGRRVRKQALAGDDPRKGKTDLPTERNLLFDNGYTQLYTLYRDEGGNIKQVTAPVSGCHCQPLLKKLEGQMKATQIEMRLHILTVQERVNSRIGRMDQRTRHQIKVLNQLNRERAAAEREHMFYMVKQRPAHDREEALRTQAAVSHELERWWMSHLKDVDVHIPASGRCYKLLPSPSMEQSEADADSESLPLLSVVSGSSSTSLANYVNILPPNPAYSQESLEQGPMGKRTYFEMKVERSPDDYQNTVLFPVPAQPIQDIPLGSADPVWQRSGAQHRPSSAMVPLCGGAPSSSSSSKSSISDQGPGLIPHQDRKQFASLISSYGNPQINTGGNTTRESVTDPTVASFNQERNSLHAMEVTQRFFDTVSTQLERWYERKLVQVEQQTELRARQDRKELLQRISTLEDELQRLKTNENAGS